MSYDFLVLFSPIDSWFLNYIDKSESIQSKKHSRFHTFNRSSSLGTVHQGQLTEQLTRFIGFQICLFAIDDLSALELSVPNDIEHISIISFLYYWLLSNCPLLLHRIDHNLEVLLREALEHYRFQEQIFYETKGFLAFSNDLGLKLGFLVVLSENFSTNASSAILFSLLFLLFSISHLSFEGFFLFFVQLVLFWVLRARLFHIDIVRLARF